MTTKLKKHARITGKPRTTLASELKVAYEKGTSLRALAKLHGRSYGFVHRVLTEAGVQMRSRGGKRVRILGGRSSGTKARRPCLADARCTTGPQRPNSRFRHPAAHTLRGR